jgi:hypothetical protein
VAGGKAEAGGQLTLTYASGDFVSAQAGVLPGSALELGYAKRWDSAELTLSLRRTTAPWGSTTPPGTTEGRLELKALW